MASTEPCTGVHGKAALKTWEQMQHHMLQRSRAPECTESRVPFSVRPPYPRFNGAVHRSARKEAVKSRDCPGTAASFNGAVHRSARKAASAAPKPCQGSGASTEPCTGVHGKPSGGLRPTAARSRFNGAVHRSARKGARDSRDDAANSSGFNGAVHRSARKERVIRHRIIGCQAASTEPCTGVHGKRS